MFMVLTASMLIWGLILTIGPAALKLVLNIIASIVPVSTVTVRFGVIFVTVVIVVGILYKSSVSGMIYKKFYNNILEIKGLRKLFKKVLTVLHIIGITGVVLIVLNPFWRFVSKLWSEFIENNQKIFEVAWYIGIVFLTTSLGMISGTVYERRRKISQYRVTQKPEPESDDYWLDDEEEMTSEDLDVFLPESASEKLR